MRVVRKFDAVPGSKNTNLRRCKPGNDEWRTLEYKSAHSQRPPGVREKLGNALPRAKALDEGVWKRQHVLDKWKEGRVDGIDLLGGKRPRSDVRE